MSFAWPWLLPALLLVPVLVGGYLWALRRRRRVAVRHPDLGLVRAALPPRSRWRPHVPVALLLAGIAVLSVGLARPQAHLEVPRQRTTIILAVDVSRSMCAVDVRPNRLSAARDAVRRFVADQPGDTRMGLVVFSGYAALVVPPTTDKAELEESIDSLTTGRGTAIGAAILTSVAAIATINPDVDPVREVPLAPSGPPQSQPRPTMPSQPPPGASEGYVSDIVVLLTDGANTRGVLPVDAAKVAAERRIRVYPVGFGTTSPTTMVCSAEQLGGDAFGETGPGPRLPGGVAGGRNFLVVDEPTLQAVAATTGGTYHTATDAAQLTEVLANVPREVVLQREQVELTAALAALGALLVLAALVLAVRWNPLA